MRRLCVIAMLLVAAAAEASQVRPAIATDGVDALVVWSENGNEFARRVDLAGQSLDVPIPLGQSGDATRPAVAAVTFGQSVYLVVWNSGNDIVARRINKFGTPLDQSTITIRRNSVISSQPIVWDGTTFVVVCGQTVMFVGEDGSVAEGPTYQAQPAYYPSSIAWDGAHFLLVSPLVPACVAGPCSAATSNYELRLLDRDGTSIGPTMTIANWQSIDSVHIATSGHEFLLTADLPNQSGTDISIQLRTVTSDVTVLPNPVLTVNPAIAVFHWVPIGGVANITNTIIWDGTQYVLAWREWISQRNWLGVMRFDRALNLRSAGSLELNVTDVHDTPAIMPGLSVTSGTFLQIHRDADLGPLPYPPLPPIVTSGSGIVPSVKLTWLRSPSNVAGYIVELDNGQFVGTVPADATSVTVALTNPLPKVVNVRMRAFNAGGISAPSNAVSVTPARRRSVGH